MIVKNEAAIIVRLLESVMGFIDTFCICDTGSTDNTIEIIEEFFQKHSISGKIIREPFRNFEYNRTLSLKQSLGMPDADYILLLDADMVFVPGSQIIDLPSWKNGLKADAYYVFQGSSTFYYKNIRLLKNTGKFVYHGVTHEYIHGEDSYSSETVDRETLFIRDIGDGGSKSDKFQRDILLLTTALNTEPANNNTARYTFYLANSYRDIGDFENAIKTYKKRIKIGGWIEEVWYSYYSLGKCYYDNKNYARAIYYWLEGYSSLSDRSENLYEIIRHYRTEQKYTLAYHFYLLATKAKGSADLDHLFIHKDIYDYKLDYEHSIIGYYANSPIRNILNSCMKVLCCPDSDASTIQSILSNYKFYAPVISEKSLLLRSQWDVLQNIDFRRDGFVSSTPTLAIVGDELWVNVRFVNYTIGERGEYLNQTTIESINVIAIFHWENPNPRAPFENLVKKREFLLNYDKSSDGKYVGLEDIRFFVHGDQVLYHANRIVDEKVLIEHGIIDIETESTRESVFLQIENQKKIEKNWVLFQDKGIKIVYNWYPLTIGTKDLLGEYIYDLVTVPSPNFFKHLRGSSHGIHIKDEIWFLCHLVSYESRRYYYHIMVVLDAGSQKIKKYTHPFTFEKSPVEYALGLVYDETADVFFISYSVMDRTSQVCVIQKSVFHDMFYMV